jgi:exopolyphosphatase/guanosine-5'-triphosphate,3'-diphosphate pyrophosphatase
MARAAIDVGSNTLLLVVLGDDGWILADEARIVGLGRGLGDGGLFAPDRMAAGEAALSEFVRIAADHGVPAWQIRAVATSGARRALNAETWFHRLNRKIGLRIETISGDEEARLTFLGARAGLTLPDGPILFIDLGGGSTELVIATGDHIDARVSLEIGSVRLTERWLGLERHDAAGLAHLRNHVDTVIHGFPFRPSPVAAVGIAGTVTTLAASALELTAWDAARVHGSTLDRASLLRTVDQLLPLDAASRRSAVPVSPERAEFLVAGATVLERVLSAAGLASMSVTTGGLRLGLLAD